MPNKRRKHQSIDFYAGALKSIMRNKEGYSAPQLGVMLEAAKMLAVLDDLPRLTGDSGQPFILPTTPTTVDPLLESLKARHAAAQDGTNAAT
jgi:hypothetical protein